MTHYRVQFNSAILELSTVSSLEQEACTKAAKVIFVLLFVKLEAVAAHCRSATDASSASAAAAATSMSACAGYRMSKSLSALDVCCCRGEFPKSATCSLLKLKLAVLINCSGSVL